MVTTKGVDAERVWAETWLEGVATGKSTMSQRSVKSVESRGGGMARVRKIAKQKGVHLVVVTDDRGVELVAASVHPFRVIC